MLKPSWKISNTAQKMKFSIKDFFSKCDQVLNGKLHFFMPWYLRLVLSNLPNCKLSSKVKILKFGIKKCFIWVFWVMVLNSYCHICHSSHICHIARSLQFCLMTMFQVKTQTLKSGTKNGYFWDRILKYYCHIWN